MFKKIVRYFANKRLFKYYQTRQRSKKIKTLKNSKSVGILWNPADEGSIETYELLRKTLQIKGIKPIGIAYIGSNLEMETLATITHSGFLHRRNVRWFGQPQTNTGLWLAKPTNITPVKKPRMGNSSQRFHFEVRTNICNPNWFYPFDL